MGGRRKAEGGAEAGVLFCPQCGERRPFVWDACLGVCRCPECGVTTEDFYVRTHNRLWEPPGRKEAVERAIRESGRERPRPKKAGEDAPAPPPEGSGPDEARLAALGFVRIECPCGRAFWAGSGKASCPKCLKRYDVREGDAEPLEDKALRCIRCGNLVTGEPEKGRAYLCLYCGAWRRAPGDEEGERQALRGEKEAEAWRRARPVKKGPLRKPALDRAKALAAKECCNCSGAGPYRAKNWCWPLDRPCVFFAPPEGDAPHRCSWFEETVIAAEEHAALMAEHERSREEPPAAAAACAEPAPAGKAARPCERCGEPFAPVLPWQATCPGGCRNGGPEDTLSYNTES